MAEIRETYLVDDLDGSREDVRTVVFGLDGHDYELDLSASHADELREALALYVAHARKAGAAKRAVPKRPSGPSETAEIREWAKSQGIPVSDRGRIPAEIVNAWKDRDSDSDDTPAEAPAVDESDAAVMAWWQAKGYKPQSKVSGLMRSQYMKAMSA